jgi:hypothetical protein
MGEDALATYLVVFQGFVRKLLGECPQPPPVIALMAK